MVIFTLKNSLLTERQKEVLRYRKKGLTLQQIADILGTSKPDIFILEKRALENIRRARASLDSLWTLSTTPICTMKAGSDLFDAIFLFYAEAAKRAIKLPEDPIELINRLRSENPERIHGRYVKVDIALYLREDGEVCSG